MGRSYVYEVYHTKDAEGKTYIGETGGDLLTRLAGHRRDALNGMDDFHKHMKMTVPHLWEIRPLHVLEKASPKERRAIEFVEISKRNPSKLWNVPRKTGGIYFVRKWRYGRTTPKGYKQSYFYIDVSEEEAKNKAIEMQKEEFPSGENNGTVRLVESWVAKINFGKKVTKSFTITKTRNNEKAKKLVSSWLDLQVKNKIATQKKLAEEALRKHSIPL